MQNAVAALKNRNARGRQSPSVPMLDAQERSSIEIDLLRIGFDRQPLSLCLLATTVVIGLVGWKTVFPRPEIPLWAALTLVAVVWGVVDTWVFKRTRLTMRNLGLWQTLFFVRSVASGSVWGIGSTMVAREANGWDIAALAVMNICIFSAAQGILMSQFPALCAFLLCAAFTFTWALLDSSQTHIQLVGVMMVLATGLSMLSGWLLNRNMRSLLVTQMRLNDARVEAESANRHKSQFLSNISHEIRTPMHAVLGMIQLLKHTPLTERQLDYANKSELAATSLLELINDVLDFSKIEAGKLTLDAKPFWVAKIMFETEAMMVGSLNAAKPIAISVTVDPAIPPVLVGDSLRLRQVLANIANNAVKFTEAGEVVLTARLLGRSAGQVWVRFAVKDTGIGIRPEKLALIFEEFSQGDAETTRRFGGSGLGLTISKRLTTMMGGSLMVESTPGRGSYFWFDLPFSAQTVEPN